MTLLIVGLWNPWDEYRHTRHNAWRIVCSSWARDQKYAGLWPLQRVSSLWWWLSRGTIQYSHCSYPLALYFPWSYMNCSWPGTLKAMSYVDASVDQVLLVYDDADIPERTTKMKMGWSHGGHNWLRDIFKHAWTNAFARLKCWIWRPSHPRAWLKDYVLWTMTNDELQFWIDRPAWTDEKIQQRIQSVW